MIRKLSVLVAVAASTVAVTAGALPASATPPIATVVKPDLVIAKASGGFVVTNLRLGFSSATQPASESFHVSVRRRVPVDGGDSLEWTPWQHTVVRGLPAGASQFVPSPLPPGGANATEAYVDSWGEVQERNEMNNMWSFYST
jgi:hypothetical protein